jgi:hypothetical protein
VRRFTGAADEAAWSADRHFVRYGLGYNRVHNGPPIVRQLPTRLLTSITPPHFFIEVFARLFDQANLWTELEQRYGPRGTVSKEEKAQIHAEISAPVRSWIMGLGIPDRVREEVLRRERRPVVERWLEAVLV